MKDFTKDSRFLLCVLMGEGLELGGDALVRLWQRASRSGRLAHQLRQLVTAGMVEQRGSGALDERLYRVSLRGRQILAGDVDVEARWARPWDGVWRMVMFDVPQARASLRVRLRRKLQLLRFGWLQNSVWLSPDPMTDLVREMASARVNVESMLFMEGRPAGGEADAELVTGAWDFARLAKVHAAYMKVIRLRPSRTRAANPAAWADWLAVEARAWREVLRCDPLLPEKLWPAGYAGRTVWNARQDALRSGTKSLLASLAHL